MPTRYSINELVGQANLTLPDNNTSAISPADVRDMIKNFLETMRPAYGVITIPSAPALNLALNTTTPVIVAPFSAIQAQGTEMVANLTNGTVTQQIAALGNTGGTSRVTFTADVVGATNADVVFTLYVNGAATPYRASVTCGGANNFGAVTFSGIVYTAGGNATFDIRATASAAGSYQISNAALIVENVPVSSFT